jgi:ABC-type sugar transport system ATPase subunit
MSFAVSQLRKSFAGIPVLRGVSFDSQPGQIHALLGANGAGKSTLIKCLSGAHAPDSGTIELNGVRHAQFTPASASAAGIAVIYQNLSLIGSLSVTDNIFLGRELRRGLAVRRSEQRRRARKTLDALLGEDDAIAPDNFVEDLPIAGQQIVAIARALAASESKLLILDEPTAALSAPEVARLKAVLRAIASRGLHVLFITHILSDVLDICQRITVLRDGVVVLDTAVEGVSVEEIAQAITGRLPHSAGVAGFSKAGAVVPRALIETRDLSAPRLQAISLAAREGKILGIFGLVGSGRSELLETLFGARAATSGAILLEGRRQSLAGGIADRLAHGVALVPGDRTRQALFAGLETGANVLQPAYRQLASGPLWRNRQREGATFASAAAAVRLVPDDPDVPVWSLSGGNAQKMVLARWAFAFAGVRVLLLDEPTQGIDVGARSEIYTLLRSEAVLAGRTIVFTTADPDEAELLADRVLVLCRGRIVGELEADGLDRGRMLALAHAAPAAEGVST